MALDTDKLRSHLKDSGLFSDAEIEAEVLSAQKDAKAEERRSILNTQKVEAPAVAESSPAIAAASPTAAAKAPSILSVPTAPAGTTPADIASGAVSPAGMGLTPEQRVGNVGVNVAKAAGNATQDSLNYARDAVANNPDLPAYVAGGAGLAYLGKKAVEGGLFSTLGDKIANKLSPTQPPPFVGGSGPRVTPAPIQSWDIHSEPSFSNPAPAITPTASPVATPSRNLTIEEAKARMAGVTPPAASVVEPVAPVAAPVAPLEPVATPLAPTTPARPATPTPPAALASTVAPVAPPTGELKTGAGLPAYAGEGKQYQRMPKEFASVKEVPAGYAFVPGVGPGTNTIRNLETPEGYRAAVQLHGGPFGSHDEAVEFMNKYNTEQRIGPPADRTLRKSLGLPLQENTKAIPSMKVAKVGGVVGAIMAIPDLANAGQAATEGKYGEAVGQTLDVASGFIPPVAQILAHIGNVNAGEDAEMVRRRQMQDYAQRAGRGVAQGYDPRRLIGVAPPVR